MLRLTRRLMKETTGCKAEGGLSSSSNFTMKGEEGWVTGKHEDNQTVGQGFTTRFYILNRLCVARLAVRLSLRIPGSCSRLDDEAYFDCASLARDALEESFRAEERLSCVPDPNETEAALKIPSVDRAVDGSSAGLRRIPLLAVARV
jgi:hypothetical protein